MGPLAVTILLILTLSAVQTVYSQSISIDESNEDGNRFEREPEVRLPNYESDEMVDAPAESPIYSAYRYITKPQKRNLYKRFNLDKKDAYALSELQYILDTLIASKGGLGKGSRVKPLRFSIGG